MSEKIAIKIGADRDAVEAARDAVMDILEARADQKTIRAALKSFTRSVSIEGCTFSNITASQPEYHSQPHHYPDPSVDEEDGPEAEENE